MMKKSKSAGWLLCMTLCVCLILATLYCVSASAAHISQPVITGNMGSHDYINVGRWTTPVQSHLVNNGDDTLTRVEYTGENVTVETYNSNLEFVKGFTIDMELPIYGGFYYGSDRNYLVFGQNNPDESDSVEVVRVVAYTRDWKRIGAASLRGANTVRPFRAGSLRFAEYGGYLYIRTSHEMYTYTDGKNHQANMTLKIRTSTMKITHSATEISSILSGYVSHSFNQFIGIDGGKVVTVDHGDAHPRSVVLCRYSSDTYADALSVLPISGATGANDTGVSVGGFVITDTHYLIAGNTVKHDDNYDPVGQRNIFVSATNKSTFSSQGNMVRYLTSYKDGDNVTVSNPHIVDLQNGTYMVLWTETSGKVQTMKYCRLNQKGQMLDDDVYSTQGVLSSCVPIVYNGRLLWYVTCGSGPKFISINLSDLNDVTRDHVYTYTYDIHPTFSRSGRMTSKCIFCGEAGEDVYVPSYSGSDEFAVDVIREPTCTEPGLGDYYWTKSYLYCKPNYYYQTQIPATGHDYGAAKVVNATCIAEGSRTSVCKTCGYKNVETIPKAEHNYLITLNPATCTTDGCRFYVCSVCGYEDVEPLKRTGHTFWTEVINQTCTKDGSRTTYCMDCDYESAEVLKATGHNYQLVIDTENYTGTYVCSKCNDSYNTGAQAVGICGEDTKWFLYHDGSLTVFGNGAVTDPTWLAFKDRITSAIVETGVTSLCDGAFYGCQAMLSAIILDNVTDIGDNAFMGCDNLIRVQLCEGLEKIGCNAFSGCVSLKDITIPNSVKFIGSSAFYNCSSLTEIQIPVGVTDIGNNAFGRCTALTDVTLQNGLRTIGERAFIGCTSLTKVGLPSLGGNQLPYTLDSIGRFAFRDCTGLTCIGIQSAIREIGREAFGSCTSLTELKLNMTQGYIGLEAFFNCSSLTTVNMSRTSRVQFDTGVFSYCTNLKKFSMPSGISSLPSIFGGIEVQQMEIEFMGAPPTQMADNCFRNLEAVIIYHCEEKDWTADKLQNYGGSITWIANHSFGAYTSDQNATCTIDGTKSALCGKCGTVDTVTVPNTAKGHDYKTVTVDATCTRPGSVTTTCANCGDQTVKTIPEIGHDYKTVTVDATCTRPGSVTTTCNNCGESNVQELPVTAHTFTEGSCTECGEADPDYIPPVVKPTLKLKAPSLEFKDMICVVAFYTAENTDDVVEMGMITYSSKASVVSIETAEHMIPGAVYDETSGRYFSVSHGIHGKNLADTVYLAIYAKLADGTYVYSSQASYSPVQYAASQLKNSGDMRLKQLVVAMLNYGAEAQRYFAYNTGSLANASLTADQLSMPESYRADMVSSVPSAPSAKQGSFANNSGFSKRYPAISFEGAFCINYFFTPKYAPSSGITLYYWNAADFAAVSVLKTSNATGSVKMTGSGTGEYRADITGISAKNLSEAVYVAAVYKNGSTTWTSGVLSYSIGSYCASQSSQGTAVAALAEATAVYGYYAKQYFG